MLVRVLEIPAPSGEYHFGGGESQAFIEIDWFRDENVEDPDAPDWMTTQEGRERILEFIKGKRYFDSAKAYLVLHPTNTMTIGYDPDEMIRRRKAKP